jgi:hypothetical protein
MISDMLESLGPRTQERLKTEGWTTNARWCEAFASIGGEEIG